MKKSLYKIDTKGKVREWTIEVVGPKYRVTTGLLDGKKVTSGWTTATPKNVGRANETSAEEQALSEAQSEIQFKYDEHYHDTVNTAQVTEKPFTPMLANRYDGWEGPCFAQPKLDGVRCNAQIGILKSRGNKPIVSVPHIYEALTKVFSVHPDLVLDGELYNHKFKDDFNKITSLVKKQKPTKADLDESAEKIEYHVYDCYFGSKPNMTFTERMMFLSDLLTMNPIAKTIVMVPTISCDDEDTLDKSYQAFLADGYEGLMIRKPNSKYEQKRSNNLLKRKPLYEEGGNDTELEIVEIEEGNGNWAGKAKAVVLKMKDGRTCRASIKGTMLYAEQVLKNKTKYVGKLATIQYQNLTPDGMPRFPICIELNRGDY